MKVQIISLIIAGLAVIIGSVVTYKITKNNMEYDFRTKIQDN